MLQAYVKKLFEITNRGDAREESFYSALENLLYSYTTSVNKKVQITTLPAQTEAGNPDFRVWDGKQSIVGYIEAKSPTIDDLNTIENSEQLTRYRHTFPNLILTNFLEYRLYRDGSLVDKVLLGRPFVLNQMQTAPPIENADAFLNLLQKFFAFSFPKVYHAKTLAVELAKRTRFLRDEVIAQELNEEEKAGDGSILSFYETFKKFLIGNLSLEDFADLYSQTITYGLFAARTRSKNGFNRKLAYDNIPHTIGILREVFSFVSLGKLPEQMEWIIDDIAEVLAVTDVKSILHKYFHQGKGKDPIVHFYETFLVEYDPKTRERRGVYYTPEPVVSYIVHSVNILLKEHFAKNDGLASDSVTVLDPAAGTLTFLAEAAKLAEKEFISKYGAGGKSDFIKEHILKNFFAFELMMAPYAIGHIKMSFLLEELGYRLHEDDRFKLYLTNTLEMEELSETQLPGMKSLSEESHLAGRVKKEIPILVIMGNPPYSVSSTNKSAFIEKEMELYKQDVKTEKNIQPLSDDYIKFIRFTQWKVEQAGRGVIGLITNNSYLSGLIHRGMRKKLLESFDQIYVLNLHGNSRIGEKSPDGTPDENIFDIQQGVAIILLVKNNQQSGLGSVFYEDIWGLRENKYDYLNKNSFNTTRWVELKPVEPQFFFVKKDFSLQSTYEDFVSVKKVFDKYSSGVKTNRDHFLVDFDKKQLEKRIQNMIGTLMDDETFNKAYNLKNGSYWNTPRERNKIRENKSWQTNFHNYAYRPFDSRYIFYQPNLIEIKRGGASKEIMRNFHKPNLALVTTRQLSTENFQHVLITNEISDICLASIKTKETGYIFPLYLLPDKEKQDLFSFAEGGEKQPNISSVIFDSLNKTYKKEITTEDIFYYIYAVLYSNTYRTKYAEFLKIDFPRIPFTKDYKLFSKMAEYGKKLVELHLLKSKELNSPIAKFQGKGDNKVEKPSHQEQEQRVYFNEGQYFEGITKEVYEYQIGGYQVCEKWLKDRKDKQLSLDDIKHYCKVITALAETIKVQQEIDSLYSQIEENLIEIFEQSEVSLQS